MSALFLPISIRTFPKQKERVETGPIRFGKDLGIFIRGDEIKGLHAILRWVKLQGIDTDKWLKLLESCK